MNEVTIIGLDLAKNAFQVHGAGPGGRVALRKKLNRGRLLEFFAKQPICVVAMDASAHYWGREIGKFGHDVRLINPACVKPFVKRQKSDAADAEAIAEAASRPTMRFVSVKSAERGRPHPWRLRLRGHLMEYGLIIPQGITHIRSSEELIATHPDLLLREPLGTRSQTLSVVPIRIMR